jgi:hypothetical protein
VLLAGRFVRRVRVLVVFVVDVQILVLHRFVSVLVLVPSSSRLRSGSAEVTVAQEDHPVAGHGLTSMS